VNCIHCGADSASICRIRYGMRAEYFCVDCMNAELDVYGFLKGDTWITVPAESTTDHLE
jgi:hypothetical protein